MYIRKATEKSLCDQCAAGNPSVPSSVSLAHVHTYTPLGRVLCRALYCATCNGEIERGTKFFVITRTVDGYSVSIRCEHLDPPGALASNQYAVASFACLVEWTNFFCSELGDCRH